MNRKKAVTNSLTRSIVVVAMLAGFDTRTCADARPTPTMYAPASSFFPTRPQTAEIRYKSGVLIQFGIGNKSGYAKIRDATGQTFGYFIGWPMSIDGKRTHCSNPPLHGQPFDPILCDGGWPNRIVIGSTRVRVYHWHIIAPWGKNVDVTDDIELAP